MVCCLSHPCLTTHTAGHYRRSSENHRLLIRYLTSRLRQLSAVWNLGEKIFIAFSECRTPSRESFSVLRRPILATLPICCHLHGYLFSTVHKVSVSEMTYTVSSGTLNPTIPYRIKFKLALLAFNARNNNAPLYLSCLLQSQFTFHAVSLTCYLCRRIT